MTLRTASCWTSPALSPPGPPSTSNQSSTVEMAPETPVLVARRSPSGTQYGSIMLAAKRSCAADNLGRPKMTESAARTGNNKLGGKTGDDCSGQQGS